MSRYYCPYCPSLYQFHKQRTDGVMICGQCGDPLVKKPFIKSTQVFALVATTAFIAPFILMLFASLKNLNKQKPQLKNAPMTMGVKAGESLNRKIKGTT